MPIYKKNTHKIDSLLTRKNFRLKQDKNIKNIPRHQNFKKLPSQAPYSTFGSEFPQHLLKRKGGGITKRQTKNPIELLTLRANLNFRNLLGKITS